MNFARGREQEKPEEGGHLEGDAPQGAGCVDAGSVEVFHVSKAEHCAAQWQQQSVERLGGWKWMPRGHLTGCTVIRKKGSPA